MSDTVTEAHKALVYAVLQPEKGYMSGIQTGALKKASPRMLRDAEKLAKVWVDEALGKGFETLDTGRVPPTVGWAALRFAAAEVLDQLQGSRTKDADTWREQAEMRLAKINSGEMGLQLADGDWDEIFKKVRCRRCPPKT